MEYFYNSNSYFIFDVAGCIWHESHISSLDIYGDLAIEHWVLVFPAMLDAPGKCKGTPGLSAQYLDYIEHWVLASP